MIRVVYLLHFGILVGFIHGKIQISSVSNDSLPTEALESAISVEKEYAKVSRIQCFIIATQLSYKLHCHSNDICKLSNTEIAANTRVSGGNSPTLKGVAFNDFDRYVKATLNNEGNYEFESFALEPGFFFCRLFEGI